MLHINIFECFPFKIYTRDLQLLNTNKLLNKQTAQQINCSVKQNQNLFIQYCYVMQGQNRNPKKSSNIRTLCTIDTSDIDVVDAKKLNSSQSKMNRTSGHEKPKMQTLDPYILKKRRQKTPIKTREDRANRAASSPLMEAKIRRKFSNLKLSRSIVKTDYSYNSQLNRTKRVKTQSSLKKKLSLHFDGDFRLEAYEIVERLESSKNEKLFVVLQDGRSYLMKKTKDPKLKKEYEREYKMKSKMHNMSSRNLVKIHRSYYEKNWAYIVYDYEGVCLSWNNPSHLQVINKILKSEGIVLKHLVKEVARGLDELSKKGYVHAAVRLQNIVMKIEDCKKSVKIQGKVKLANFSESFLIRNKHMLLVMPENIYTPPEIINYLIFEKERNRFDRQLLDYIGLYDEAWYIDVWALGILILELIAGESISLQKVLVSKKESPSASQLYLEQPKQEIRLVDDEITLPDILYAQKNLLFQTEAQIDLLKFDPKLQNLVIRMLSINPFNRPRPSEIIRDL